MGKTKRVWGPLPGGGVLEQGLQRLGGAPSTSKPTWKAGLGSWTFTESQAVEQLLADEGGDAHRGQASSFLGLQKLRQRTVLPANWRAELSPQEEGSRESLRHACPQVWDATSLECHLKVVHGTSLVVQWLRLCAPNAGAPGLMPGQGTRSHMPQLRVRMPQLGPSIAN